MESKLFYLLRVTVIVQNTEMWRPIIAIRTCLKQTINPQILSTLVDPYFSAYQEIASVRILWNAKVRKLAN
jgi:hypothetical protein